MHLNLAMAVLQSVNKYCENTHMGWWPGVMVVNKIILKKTQRTIMRCFAITWSTIIVHCVLDWQESKSGKGDKTGWEKEENGQGYIYVLCYKGLSSDLFHAGFYCDIFVYHFKACD